MSLGAELIWLVAFETERYRGEGAAFVIMPNYFTAMLSYRPNGRSSGAEVGLEGKTALA